MTGRGAHRLVLMLLLALALPAESRAQRWSADLSAGRSTYDPLAATVSTTNLVGTLRYETAHDAWVYGTLAPPLGTQNSTWGAGGTGGRLTHRRARVGPLAFGADLAGHAFTFADGLTARRGAGATVEAMPYVLLSATRAYAEIHGGWRGHSLSHAGAAERRSVVETGARMGYDARAHLQGEARVVRAAEGTFSYAGLTVSHAAGALSAWARAGRWMSGTLDDAAWGVGAAYALDGRSRIWASLQQEAPDPLYWNAPRRAWSVGVTRQLGRVPASPAPVPQAGGGRVTIRVAAEDAPPGAVALGGSFNDWQPAPMRREGDFWVLTLPLAPGVYHYAFRAGADGWFVPDSVAGRRPDGMGGFTAVLVVL